MPDKESFRRRVLECRPEYRGRLRFNKTGRNGDYSVTVRGICTVYWFRDSDDLDSAIKSLFEHVDYKPENFE